MEKELEGYPICRYHKYWDKYEVCLRLSGPWLFKIVGTLDQVKEEIDLILNRTKIVWWNI